MKALTLALMVSLCCSLSGCVSHVSIGRILNDPHKYQNRVVRLNGRVTESVNAIVAGGYQIEDDTGKIVILSGSGAPRKGSEVSLTGRVSSTVTFLGQPFGIIVREHGRNVLTRTAKH